MYGFSGHAAPGRCSRGLSSVLNCVIKQHMAASLVPPKESPHSIFRGARSACSRYCCSVATHCEGSSSLSVIEGT